ncbi:hypothetical protein QFZ81_006323 [Paenibacillus sp. V4I9]|nr:hypothetical protein [Paenibacillus sp. V4I9]
MSQSFYNRRCGCRLFGLLHTPWIGGLMVLVAVVK